MEIVKNNNRNCKNIIIEILKTIYTNKKNLKILNIKL